MLLKTRLILSIAAALLASPSVAANGAAPASSKPWMDPALDPDMRAHLLVKAMTLVEKQALLFGYFSTDQPDKKFVRPEGGMPDAAGFIAGNARLSIPAQSQTDAGNGVATQRGPKPRLRTALPAGIAAAASWNRETAFVGGAMIGNEARLSGFNILLAGGVNLLREPRNGRNFEYGGEDPLLAGSIVGHAIKGIQSNNIISTLKHFAFNDQETDRLIIDVKIGEAAGRQSDLLALQIANEIGRPGAVMCAYNRVNGVYACENDWLLNRVLKKDWGFKGYVMSDWGATHSTIPAANAGLDQQTGYPLDKSPYFGSALVEAVESGWVKPERLDDMARRVLRTMFAGGLFERPVSDENATIDYAGHAAISQAAAEEAIVLMKNDARLLPIAKSAKSILVIGGHADVGVLSGGGSSQVYPRGGPENGMILPNKGPETFPGPVVYYPSSPVAALKKRVSARVSYVDGADVKAAAAAAAKADVVIVFATQWWAESLDVDLNLPDNQDALIARVTKANPRTIVVLETGGPVLMPWVNSVGAVVAAWYPGTSGGDAIARVLTGEVNPSGHLPVTFPASLDQLPRKTIDSDVAKTGHPYVDYNIEGAAVGYKWFDKNGLRPLFPFGHGLSYSDFVWSELSAKTDGKEVAVSVMVRNVGSVPGRAVTQVYVSGPAAAGWEAPRRLGAFDKTALAAGESKPVGLRIDPRLLATWDAADQRWKIAAGEYKVMIGSSATGLGAATTVRLEAGSVDVQLTEAVR